MREWIGVVHHTCRHGPALAAVWAFEPTRGAASISLGTQLSVSHLHLAFCRSCSRPEAKRCFLIRLQTVSNATNRGPKEAVIMVTSAGSPSHHPRMKVALELCHGFANRASAAATLVVARTALPRLKRGGVVVVEGFLRTPQTPQGASFDANELLKMFHDLNMSAQKPE